MAARLPARQAGLRSAAKLPGGAPDQAGHSPRRIVARVLTDLRAGRVFLAGELSQHGWLDFGQFRWRDLTVAAAIRTSLGVMTPLTIGIATGNTAYGTFAALGALLAGFVSFRGVNRTRVLAVVVTTVGMAISTFVGAATAAWIPWLLVPAVFVWAYAAGLLVALGQTALSVCVQWPVALLIATAIPLGPEHAAVRALLVLAGGLWQAVLIVSTWPVNRGGAERSAIAESYRTLAGYARDLAAGRTGLPPPEMLPGARALDDPNPLIQTAAREHLLDMAEEADRIRVTVAALSADGLVSDSAAGTRPLLTGTADVLAELADSLTGRRGKRASHLDTAAALLAGLSVQPGSPWHWSGEALLGQLRAAWQIAGRVSQADAVPPGRARPARQLTARYQAALAMRASIGTESEAGRHALRLAVSAALAEAIVRATGLGHGYWAVLTIFIVLRPDYTSTVHRGLQRAAGTVVGAGLGVGTVLLARISDGALLTGIGATLLAAYAVFTVNNLLYAVFLTDFVVVLLALLGLPPLPTAEARLAGTAIGTALALLAYVVWPTWAGDSATENFARLIEAQVRYAAALLRGYTRPSGGDAARLGELQLDARRARIDVSTSTDRLADEPDQPPITSRLALALGSASHRVAQACLTLAAAVTAHHATGPPAQEAGLQPQLDELAAMVEQAGASIAGRLRVLGSPMPAAAIELPPLRAKQRAIWPAQAVIGGEEAGLAAAADGLVDAIDTEADVLSDK